MKCHLAFITCLFYWIAPASIYGQSLCDSVEVQSVAHPLFSDTFVHVLVENNSMHLFGYPGFILFDQQGDTLAKEQVNYFGIGQKQLHRLAPKTENLLNAYPQARLELWQGFYDSLVCTFVQDVNLCPADSCASVVIHVGNFGGALANASYVWQLEDTIGGLIASGQLELIDTGQQEDADTVCIVPGPYQLNMNVSNVTGGQVWIGLYGIEPYEPGIQEPVNFNGNTISFEVLKHCINTIEHIPEIANKIPLKIIRTNQTLQISRTDQQRIGKLALVDGAGRIVHLEDVDRDRYLLNIARFLPGTYILTIEATGAIYSEKVIVGRP